MNRDFDERMELQLQEYEFAELDQLMPARQLNHAADPVVMAGNEPIFPEGGAGMLDIASLLQAANQKWTGNS